MALNNQWDGYELKAPALPYDRSERELSEKPRLVAGSNLYVTTGGALCRRPGTSGFGVSVGSSLRIDRLWIYETLTNPAIIYIVASMYNSIATTWELYSYKYIVSVPTAWLSLGSYREINVSTRPHEAVSARGKLYVKSFPNGSSEKLGTVVLDGSSGTMVVYPWGILGPTQPARIKGAVTKITTDRAPTDTSFTVSSTTGFPAVPFVAQVNYEQINCTALVGSTYTVTRGYNDTTVEAHAATSPFLWRNWSASGHIVTVNQFWRYAYAYKTITGHISNRSPEESNPDLLPSRTGPFFDQCPQVTLRGTADTTNVPTIVVYRSTDGGGTFYKLTEVTNPGASDFTFTDNLLGTGASSTTFNDPTPDSVLDTQDVGPSLTSNSPPPTVLAPLVTGTDTPAASTPLTYYQGRIWYGIGNYIFFSSQEELNSGIPEEAFPSGTFGNFFKYQENVSNLERTNKTLFVGTIGTVHAIGGSTRETFASFPSYENYGMAAGHPRAITKFGSSIAFLSHDYRIMLMDDNGLRVISDPLGSDITDLITAGGEIDIKYTADMDREWLVVAGHRYDSLSNCRQWVYDLKRAALENRDFWFTPWNFPSVCLASGRISYTNSQRRLIAATLSVNNATLVKFDNTGLVAVDITPSGSSFGTAAYDLSGTVNLTRNPPGNHVNELRRPGLTSVVERLVLERTKYTSDTDPTLVYYKDDFWTTPVTPTTSVQAPARRAASVGFKSLNYHINEACDRFGFKFSKTASTDLFTLQNYSIIWKPESGA